MNKVSLIIASFVIVAIILASFAFKSNSSSKSVPSPTEVPEAQVAATQLKEDDFPEVKLTYSPDSHFVTVDISNIQSEQIEYNLIYDAVVKGNKIQTGVNASAKLDGKSTYTQKQLLGSESNKKFTYHQNIQNAMLELTLRDSAGRSVYSGIYPFEVKPGKSQTLVPNP